MTRTLSLQTSPHYVELIDGLLRAACAACKSPPLILHFPLITAHMLTISPTVDVEDLRKLSKTLSNMATEKQKLKVYSTCFQFVHPTSQPYSPPLLPQAPKAKKKVKASLGVGKAAKKADIHHDYHDYDDDLGGEYDDFM